MSQKHTLRAVSFEVVLLNTQKSNKAPVDGRSHWDGMGLSVQRIIAELG